MSLEQAIKENTDAVTALTKALLARGSTKTESTPAPAKPAASSPAAKPAPGGALTYDKDVKPVLQKLLAKNRDKLQEILKSFGAANGQQLKPEQYSEVIAKVDEALA